MRLYLLLLLVFFFSCLSGQIPKVLVIGIDGCRSDVLEIANTPNIDNLIANGYYSPDGLNNDITISGPGWSAIICGVRSNKHGVTDNSFSGSNYGQYPDFLKRIKLYNPALFTASIVHWNPINDQIIDNIADFKRSVATDQAVEDEAVQLVSNQNPDAIFLHFDDPDGAGHAGGFAANNANYITQIEEVDSHVGAIMDAIADRPNYDNEDWLILLTPDHGGLGNSHGGSSIEEEKVFFIASGDGVPQETVKATEVITPPPFDCLGDDFELYFDGNNDRVEVAETPLFNFGANQDFTVECRVKTSIAADVAIVGDKDWDSGVFPGFVLSFRFPSGPEWKVNLGDGSNRADLNVDVIADGEWHTLSVSFDRDGELRAYEDGVFKGAVNIAGIGNITTTEGLFFGADEDNEYDYNGSLSEVRIWNGIISPQAIADWHCQRLDNTHPAYANLLGYWPLNENGGVEALDLSVNDNPGMIVGATWQNQPVLTTYNYDNTPRLEDVAVTALQHLCIPILPEWELDGVSRVNSCGVLPVVWQSFDASYKQKNVKLIWTTTDEQNNAGFSVERMDDKGIWQTISPFIVARQIGEYAYLDEKLPNGITQLNYRVRQQDVDGVFTYSPIRTVAIPNDQSNLEVFPNPTSGQVSIENKLGFTGLEKWALSNSAGKVVAQGKAKKGKELLIDLTTLPDGVYEPLVGNQQCRIIRN